MSLQIRPEYQHQRFAVESEPLVLRLHSPLQTSISKLEEKEKKLKRRIQILTRRAHEIAKSESDRTLPPLKATQVSTIQSLKLKLEQAFDKINDQIVIALDVKEIFVSPFKILTRMHQSLHNDLPGKAIILLSIISSTKAIQMIAGNTICAKAGLIADFGDFALRANHNIRNGRPTKLVIDAVDLCLALVSLHMSSKVVNRLSFNYAVLMMCNFMRVKLSSHKDSMLNPSIDDHISRQSNFSHPVQPHVIEMLQQSNIRSHELMNLLTIPVALINDPYLPRDAQTGMPMRFPVEIEILGQGRFLVERSRALAMLNNSLRRGNQQIQVTNPLPLTVLADITSRLNRIRLELQAVENTGALLGFLQETDEYIQTSTRTMLDKICIVDEVRDNAWEQILAQNSVGTIVRESFKWGALSLPTSFCNTLATTVAITYDRASSILFGRNPQRIEINYPDQFNRQRLFKDWTIVLSAGAVGYKIYKTVTDKKNK